MWARGWGLLWWQVWGFKRLWSVGILQQEHFGMQAMVNELKLLVQCGFVLLADYVEFFKVIQVTSLGSVGVWFCFA